MTNSLRSAAITMDVAHSENANTVTVFTEGVVLEATTNGCFAGEWVSAFEVTLPADGGIQYHLEASRDVEFLILESDLRN